jgi:phosphatidylglycerophosphate synthase
METRRYRYATSEKSFLDVRHDAFWNDTVEWIYRTYPQLTPNQLTMLGVFPVILLSVLHIIGLLGSITFPLLSIVLIWYLNIDAMDGKLARHSNRSTPVGQVMDHGIDALVGGLLSVMVCSFLGFTNMVFYAIAVALTTLMFFQATLKEHLTHEMLVSIRFYFGRSENTSIVMSTTELMYGLSILFSIGYFGIYGDMFFCLPAYLGLTIGLIYINDLMFRQNIHHLHLMNQTRRKSESSTDSSESTHSSSSDSQPRRRKNTAKNSSTRREVYDSNMRPTGDYVGFDLFPQPAPVVEETDDTPTTQESSVSYIPNIDLTNIREKLESTPYFTFVMTGILGLVLYLITAGAVYQLLMMILYTTTVTVDLIFLNTLNLNLADRKSKVLVRRFTSRNAIIFSGLKILGYIVGLLALVVGLAPSTLLAFGLVTVIDIFFIVFYITDILDKADVVMSYFKNE